MFSSLDAPLTDYTTVGTLHSLVQLLEHLSIEKPGYRFIKPSNFSFEADRIQFSASDLTEDLQCVSPEETGLLVDLPDNRSGLYRLGVVLYHAVSGAYPFQSDNPMDLIYAHLTKTPKTVVASNPKTPKALSDVIDKLLQKQPSNRYQSYEGLLEDLKVIADYPAISNFVPGEKDVSSEILFSSKLYGRSKTLQPLLDILLEKRTRNGVLLISGEPGIGKTAAVAQVVNGLKTAGTITAMGKFEQFKRDVPYSGLGSVLTDLVKQILIKGSDALESFKSDLIKVCPHESVYLGYLSKDFQRIVGVPDTELSSTLIKPIVETALKAFFKVLSSTHNSVLFVDDLQWADSASMELLLFISSNPEIKCVVLGAYRDNEVSPVFQAQLDTLRSSGGVLHELSLHKLSLQDLNEWIKDLTCMPVSESMRFADFMEKRTFGNPFYFRQLIKSLEKQGCIFYEKGCWHFDLVKAERIAIPNEAADLLLIQLNELPEKEKAILGAAAVVGDVFQSDLLTTLVEGENLEESIHACELRHLIFPIRSIKNPDFKAYKFAHDTIRTFFYTGVDSTEKEKYHFLVGNYLQSSGASLFEWSDHYNQCPSFFQTPTQKITLAKWNLEAGKQAKRSAATKEALQYLSVADTLMPEKAWVTAYDLKLETLLEKAEVSYLMTEYELAEELCREILAHTPPQRALLKTKELLVLTYIAQGKMREAVDYTVDTLNTLNVSLPHSATEEDVMQGFEEVTTWIDGRQASDLLALPAMNNWEAETAMRFVMHGGSAAYFVAQDIYPLMILKQVVLSIKHGNCGISADAYTTYGLLLSAFAGDIPGGYAFGRLGVEVMNRYQAFTLEAKVATMFNGFVQHVQDPIWKTISPLKKGFVAGMERGDIEYACYNLTFLFIHQLFTTTGYAAVAQEQEKWLQVMKELKNEQTLEMALPWHHLLLELSSLAFDRKEAESFTATLEQGENPIAKAYAFIARLTSATLFSNTKQALVYGAKVPPLLEQVAGIYVVPLWEFYYGITLAEEGIENETVEGFIADLQMRAVHAPENHAHKHLLLSAIKNIKSDGTLALELFEKAVEAAEKSGMPLEAGFVYEKYARYLLTQNKYTHAAGLLLQSLKYYSDGGIDKKAAEISGLLKEVSGITEFHSLSDYSGFSYKEIYKTVLQEIHLDSLVQQLLSISLKVSGADRSLLIVNGETPLVVGQVEESGYVECRTALSAYQNAPIEFIYDALLSGEEQTWYKNDESTSRIKEAYFLSEKKASAIAKPLKIEDKVIGVLYLESKQAAIFSDTSLSLLRLLGNHIAVSINNALLYEELRQKEEKLSKAVHEKALLVQDITIQKKKNVLGIIEAEETEKQRLSRELHDNSGQQIAALKMLLQGISTDEKSKLEQLQTLADEISTNLREIAHRMMPKTLDQLGLAAAINDLLNMTFAHSSIDMSFDCFGEEKKRLPKAMERTLYRITQELISNVLKHSQAKEVHVQLTIHEKNVILTVEDNGVGSKEGNGGIGLHNIKTRLELFEGTLSFENLEPTGTLAIVKIPTDGKN